MSGPPSGASPRSRSFSAAARDLAAVGRRFAANGWVRGTSGNFSTVLNRNPLRLAISASGVDKSTLAPSDILQVDSNGTRIGRGAARASAETLLHLEIVQRRGAGAVLHTHSVWSTILSDAHAASGVLQIGGYEMLKGLHGVTTHEHVERVPVIANEQEMTLLAARAGVALDEYPAAHAFLLQRHGLYTWGRTLAEAIRHVEILEFLFEVVARRWTYLG